MTIARSSFSAPLALLLATFAGACSAAPSSTSAESESALGAQAASGEPTTFNAQVQPAENYGLFVHGASKPYFNDRHRQLCGGAYTVTTVLDLGRVSTEGFFVKTVTFWTEGESIIMHQPFVWVGTNRTHLEKFTDWNTGTDEAGKPYLTFTVNRWFEGGNEADGDGLQIQHTMIPDAKEAWAAIKTWGNPAGPGTAGVANGLPDNPDGSYCSLTQRGALQTPAVVTGALLGDFCPKENVKRQDMAKYLVRIKHGAGFVPPGASGRFADVDGANAPWTEQLAADGITKGCGQGTLSADGYWSMFCPQDAVPREQMATFFVRLRDGRDYVYGKDIGGPAGGPFADVPASDQFAGNIQRLLDYGITKGCLDGNFCPKENVTREQMAAFLMRYVHGASIPASGQRFGDVSPSSEFVNEIGRAVEDGIMEKCR